MAIVYLTREIDNADGYIDEVIDKIESVPEGELLEMHVTCEGGDVYQGARIHYSVMSHKGATKFVGIGLAASMGGVLLSAFDEVELDEELDLMLHKAHIPGVEESELEAEQRQIIQRFNNKAYKKLVEAGGSEEFLNKVFLSEETKDYWLTAKEAESLGLGKVTKIERRDSAPFKVAAKLDIEKIKNKYKNNMFGKNKNKKVAHVIALADGRKAVYMGEADKPQVGDSLTIVGSNELLTGEVRLQDNLVAEIGEENEITNIEEVTDEVTDEMFADLIARVEALEAWKAENESGDDTEASEAVDKANELLESAQAVAENVLAAAKVINNGFKPPKVEDKHQEQSSGLSPQMKHELALRAALAGAREEKTKKAKA